MTSSSSSDISRRPTVVVTGANGFVGTQVCHALVGRGATVRAVVRRPGSAPTHPDVIEVVGDFTHASFAAQAVDGADALVTTVHPMGSDREAQHEVGVVGTTTIARAAADVGVPLLVHVSTAAVYDRSPGAGDVSEGSPLVDDDSNDYSVTKRDTDAAIAGVDGITRVLVRPPAILGAGDTSVWNTLRPASMRDHESERHAVVDKSFPWIHVTDLAAFIAVVATGGISTSDDTAVVAVAGACTPVNVAAETATYAEYHQLVAEAVGVAPVWDDSPAWTGRLLADRARGWGWSPQVTLREALDEVRAGLTTD
ncbi:MAG: NAD-dependent epimerase/dehydratase family protein [Aeromicrobium sp.]